VTTALHGPSYRLVRIINFPASVHPYRSQRPFCETGHRGARSWNILEYGYSTMPRYSQARTRCCSEAETEGASLFILLHRLGSLKKSTKAPWVLDPSKASVFRYASPFLMHLLKGQTRLAPYKGCLRRGKRCGLACTKDPWMQPLSTQRAQWLP
jgi:hypothetical protein